MSQILSARQVRRLALQIEIIRRYYKPQDTFRVLDLGTEFGHTAVSIRDNFPNARIDGVEIHGFTIEACRAQSGKVYDAIFLEDALEFLRSTKEKYDVIVAAELIEHLSKSRGKKLLGLLFAHPAKVAIVTSPMGYMEQGSLHGNPFQQHISGWTPAELEKYGWTVDAVDAGRNLFVSHLAPGPEAPAGL